ncbi:MAG: 50S ribosomal protein L9 [Chlamydiae bacterium]|nr:50S ribosomal protein L9 [Chlamydiota bacterium]
MKQTLLLLKDVEDLGKGGEVVSVRAGYARNFLLPQQLGVIADKHTLRMQEKLKKERALNAEKDKKEAEELAQILEKMTLTIRVKVDAEGKMYGSVSAFDVLHLLEKEGIKGLSKKAIQIKKHLKELGTIDVPLKLKEEVMSKIKLEILPEEGSVFIPRTVAPSEVKVIEEIPAVETVKEEEKPKSKRKAKEPKEKTEAVEVKEEEPKVKKKGKGAEKK